MMSRPLHISALAAVMGIAAATHVSAETWLWAESWSNGSTDDVEVLETDHLTVSAPDRVAVPAIEIIWIADEVLDDIPKRAPAPRALYEPEISADGSEIAFVSAGDIWTVASSSRGTPASSLGTGLPSLVRSMPLMEAASPLSPIVRVAMTSGS